MGDLVGSENMASTEHLHLSFNAAVKRQNKLQSTALASPLTITLGDEFQGLATSLVTAWRIAREIRLSLLNEAIDCRFAIGPVRLQTPLNTRRAWNMMGTGLSATRERLNEKKANSLYRFSVPQYPVLETMLEASGASLTAIERRWTNTQRHDIHALLQGESPADIAKRRNVSAHSIYKVRNSGDFDLYVMQLNAAREALAEIDKGLEMNVA